MNIRDDLGESVNEKKDLKPLFEVLAVATFFGFFQFFIFEPDLLLKIFGITMGIACFILFGRAISEMSFDKIGLVTHSFEKNILLGLCIGFILHILFVVYYFFMYEKFLLLMPIVNLIIIPIALIIVFSEELFFRGYMLPRLEDALSTNAAIMINSFLFCIYHQSLIFGLITSRFSFSIIEAMLVNLFGSIILSILFVKTRSLVTPVVTHALFDILFYVHFPFPTWLIPSF